MELRNVARLEHHARRVEGRFEHELLVLACRPSRRQPLGEGGEVGGEEGRREREAAEEAAEELPHAPPRLDLPHIQGEVEDLQQRSARKLVVDTCRSAWKHRLAVRIEDSDFLNYSLLLDE